MKNVFLMIVLGLFVVGCEILGGIVNVSEMSVKKMFEFN